MNLVFNKSVRIASTGRKMWSVGMILETTEGRYVVSNMVSEKPWPILKKKDCAKLTELVRSFSCIAARLTAVSELCSYDMGLVRHAHDIVAAYNRKLSRRVARAAARAAVLAASPRGKYYYRCHFGGRTELVDGVWRSVGKFDVKSRLDAALRLEQKRRADLLEDK